jgi:hypothetical protein
MPGHWVHSRPRTFQSWGLHDLVAGKLIALLDRSAARDVFDAAGLFNHPDLDMDRLRLSFVVMGAMSRTMDLRAATPEGAQMAPGDFDRMVRPLMRPGGPEWDLEGIRRAAREGLAKLLPLRPHEAAFIEALWDRGEIHPELLTVDLGVQAAVATMPLLIWKAQHVRSHRGLDR